MKYPQLQIDRQKLIYNVKRILELTDRNRMHCHFVTKGFCAYRPMVDAMVEAGAQYFADSRLENIKRLDGYGSSHMLIRIPMITEVADVVQYCDLSLNSDYKTLCALSDAALTADRRHGVLLMVELGDLREGFMPDEIVKVAGDVLKLRGLYIAGLAANFNCYGGVIGDEKKLTQLVALADEIRQTYDIRLPMISGGNSGLVYLLEENRMPEGVNDIRLGESVLFGRETSYGRRIADLYTDVFTLRGEVIECRRKPSVPDGEIGPNAFGEFPVFEDRGIIRRALVAVGRHDASIEDLVPRMSGIEILGASSDHLILDVTNAVKEVQVGDIIDFGVNYNVMFKSMLSPYVYKRMV